MPKRVLKRYRDLERTRRCGCCSQAKPALSDCFPCRQGFCPKLDKCKYELFRYQGLIEVMTDPLPALQGKQGAFPD